MIQRHILKEKWFLVLLQNGADPKIQNTDGKTALDSADASARTVLSGEYKKEELLESARSGSEEKMLQLITPLNVNCHAADGRKVTFELTFKHKFYDSLTN